MQLTPRYLVKNSINLIANHAGLGVEYRPVFQRNIRITRGIDNVIQFRLLNADQKPVVIAGQPVFVAFDETGRLIFERPCDILDDGSTTRTLGVFTVTITDDDLLSVQQQYLKYNVYLLDSAGQRQITYANTDFASSGIIYVDAGSYPTGPENLQFDQWYTQDDHWYSTPNRHGTENVSGNHTLSITGNGYQGIITVEATLESSSGINWFSVISAELTGAEAEPVILNFTGAFVHIRLRADTDPRPSRVAANIRV
jgi:hypothetical protein